MWRTFYLYDDAWGNTNRIALRKPKKLRSFLPTKEVELYQIKYNAYFCQYQLALSRLSDKTLVGVAQPVGDTHADCFADRSCTELITKVLYDGSDEYEFELPSDEIDDCGRYCWAPGLKGAIELRDRDGQVLAFYKPTSMTLRRCGKLKVRADVGDTFWDTIMLTLLSIFQLKKDT